MSTHVRSSIALLSLPGIFLTISFDWIHAEKFSLKQYVMVSICIILTCEVTYFSLEALELDPQWSFKLADRWCLEREWVHWDTTPFNAIFRDAGSILGGYMCWFSAKGTNWHMHPSKTQIRLRKGSKSQISLRIRPV